MSAITLRDYQERAVNEVREAFMADHKAVLFQLATGAGKTLTAGFILAAAALKNNPGMFICNRVELLEQTARAFDELGIYYGIVAAGFTANPYAPVQIASIDTLKRRLATLKVMPKLVVWDECRSLGSVGWTQVYEFFKDAVHLGLDATPIRLDGKGLGQYFTHLVCGPTYSELQARGSLVPFDVYAPSIPDLSAIKKLRGDFDGEALEALLDTPTLVGDVPRHYLELARGKQGITFAISRKHSEHLAQAYRDAGVRAMHLDGDTDKAERKRVVAAFRRREIDVLTNVDLFTAGFDVPGIEVITMVRPTQSLAVYLQQAGRGSRPDFDSGKDRCILLDHAGNALRHGLPDADREWSLEGRVKRAKKSDAEEIQAKQCEACLPAGTPVLTDDMRWVRIGDVEPGQKLAAFDEYPCTHAAKRKFRTATVVATIGRRKNVFRIVTTKGEVVCTDDHRWLATTVGGHSSIWLHTRDLKPGNCIKSLGFSVGAATEFSADYRAGYISGITLGDGTLRDRPEAGKARYWRVALCDMEPLHRLTKMLCDLGVSAQIRQQWTPGNPKHRAVWKVETRARASVDIIAAVVRNRIDSDEFARGFMAGFFDAEGQHQQNGIQVSQISKPVLEYFADCGRRFGFDFRIHEWNNRAIMLRLRANVGEKVRFFSTVNPAIQRKVSLEDTALRLANAEILSIEPLGEDDVVDIQTTTGTFFAGGFASHNCYAVFWPPPTCPACGHTHEVAAREVEEHDGQLVKISREELRAIREAEKEAAKAEREAERQAKREAKAAEKEARLVASKEARRTVGMARSLEDLEAIAAERGYHADWAKHTWAHKEAAAQRKIEAQARAYDRSYQ